MLVELAGSSERGLAATGYDPDELDALLFDLEQRLEFAPDEETAALDRLAPRPKATCPKCGHQFTWDEQT